jgi:hypothetical protein
MQLTNLVQDLIHRLESGRGLRFVSYVLVALIVILRAGSYDLRSYQNMSAPEAMDAAQLAHNIARGRGYTTEFIRPLSIYLVRSKGTDSSSKDPAHLNAGHPDISNAPGYPVVLAGLMKILPFHYDASLKGSFWSEADVSSVTGRRGIRYQPDFLIAVFNQVLFVVIMILAFFWAKRLFDAWVAWTSFFVLLGTQLLWRFSVSGLSTMMLMLIFMGLFWCLTLYEREVREPKWGDAALAILSVAAGALTGAGALTRYSFMWMIIPVALFLVLFGGQGRIFSCAVAVGAFVLVFGPWVVRNYVVSGTLFGTASYSLSESFYPEFHLQRSLQPEFPSHMLGAYVHKAATELPSILESDLFKMAGGWITALFLAGLLLGFRSLTLRRMRYFTVASIAVLAIAQALGRTQLSDETPEINSENLLVLLAPVVVVYGVGIFYLLLDNMKLNFSHWRYVGAAIFIIVLSLPMLFSIMSGKKNPVTFPPYRPDVIQNSSTRILKPSEMMMSDIPWAVAWYGDRQCVWRTLYANPAPDKPRQWQESFYAINDALKPINALYLTPESLDSRFQSQWLRAGESSWGDFTINTLLNKQVPPGFPLRKMPDGYLPEQLLLADWVRW